MGTGLVIAGCLSGEKNDAGVAALVGELSRAVPADVCLRARTGGRPVGPAVPEALAELRVRGVRRALVVTTHVADGELQRACAEAVRAAASGFDELRLARPLLAGAEDLAVVAAALDEAIPARPGRVVALAGHRGAECAAAFAGLSRALAARGREDVVVVAQDCLLARVAERTEREVLLGPFLMAMGTHARRDVLVGLRSSLELAGHEVGTWPHSLAELPAIRSLVCAHALEWVPGGRAARLRRAP